MPAFETVTARPLSFDDIAALAVHDAEPFTAFVHTQSIQNGTTLTPITITPEPRFRAHDDAPVPHRPVHEAVPDERRNATPNTYRVNKDLVVGYAISCASIDMFGSQQGMWFFTSADAEAAALHGTGHSRPEHDRQRVFVADPAGDEYRLTPVHGSQVSTGFIVTGIDADEALARTEAALRAEFGDALRANTKFQSRPVPERRVNVYTSAAKEQMLAANVLSAEVSYFMRTGSAYTEDWDPTTAIG